MSKCMYCGRIYNDSESSAVYDGVFHKYCSRMCELRAKRARENRENANTIAEASRRAEAAARDQADAERESAEAARRQARAYEEMQRSQEEIERNRQKQERLNSNTRSIQERAKGELEDLSRMFVTKNGLKYREAVVGSSEYRMRSCSVSDFTGNSETSRNSSSTCKLMVNSVLNKTPKGSGCLHFNIYYLPEQIKDPFVEKPYYFDYSETKYNEKSLKGASGVTFWQKNDSCETAWNSLGFSYDYDLSDPDYDSKNKYYPIYSSDKFNLNEAEEINNKSFIMKRTRKPIAPGYYALYVALIETLANGEEEIVAYCKTDGLHTTINKHLKILSNKKFGKIGEKTNAIKIGKFDYGCHFDGKKTVSFSFSGAIWSNDKTENANDAPGELYFTVSLKDYETGKTEPLVTSDTFRTSYISFLFNCSSSYVCRKRINIPVSQEGFYVAEIKLYELDENGNGRLLDTVTKNCGPSGLCIVNDRVGTRNASNFKVECKNTSYSISGGKVTIKMDRLQNLGKYDTGALKICLEYETNGKRTVAAECYKNFLKKDYGYPDVNVTVNYNKPSDYCDASVPIISVYTLDDRGYWVRNSNKDVEFYSKTEKAKIEADKKKAEEDKKKQIAANNARIKADKKNYNYQKYTFLSLPLLVAAYCAYKGIDFSSFVKSRGIILTVVLFILAFLSMKYGFYSEIFNGIKRELDSLGVLAFLKGLWKKYGIKKKSYKGDIIDFIIGILINIICMLGELVIVLIAAGIGIGIIGVVTYFVWLLLGVAMPVCNTPLIFGLYYVFILNYIIGKIGCRKKINHLISRILSFANLAIPIIIMLLNWVIIPNYSRIDAKLKARENNKKVEQVDKPIEQVMNEND